MEYEDGGELCRGLMLSIFLPDNVGSKEIFRQISYDRIVLRQGTSSGQPLTTEYKGNVDWTVSDKNIVSFDKSTGKITARNPGTAIITAKVGTTRRSCIVYSVSQWLEPETAVATKDVIVRETPSATGDKAGTVLTGSSMTADGDFENGMRWVYVTSGTTKGFVNLDDFPGINYLMAEYHYYDQGFEERFGSGSDKIRSYSSVLNDVMMRIFGLKISQHVEAYTSLADECKIKTFGSVYKNNLDLRSCPKTNGHCTMSCLHFEELRGKFLLDKGRGSVFSGKCLWSGHFLEPYGVGSVTHVPVNAIVFTYYGVYAALQSSESDEAADKEYIIKTRFFIEIIHETAHLLGTKDGYCKRDGENGGHCSNEYCYKCNGLPVPECIMVDFDGNVEYADTVFCNECINKINEHLSDHH